MFINPHRSKNSTLQKFKRKNRKKTEKESFELSLSLSLSRAMAKGRKLPSEEGEGDGEEQGLETDAGVEVVEGGVVGVAVAGLGDWEPGVLRVELGEVAHLLQVALHVHQHPLHGGADGAQEPRRDERRRRPRLGGAAADPRLLPRRPLAGRRQDLRRRGARRRRNRYQLRLRPLLHNAGEWRVKMAVGFLLFLCYSVCWVLLFTLCANLGGRR